MLKSPVPPRLEDKFRIRVAHADAQRRCTPSALMSFFQEVAYDHANELGLGVKQLGASKLAWVLHRIQVEVDRFATIGETLTVTTWPTDLERSLAMRDFSAADESGAVVARGSSAWAVVSLEVRGAIRIPSWIAGALDEPVAQQLPFEARRVGRLARVDRTCDIAVRRHDIDMLEHVNNVRYLEWALENVPDEVWAGRTVRRLDAQFRAEAVYGDAIVCDTEIIDDDSFLHRLTKDGGDRELVVVKSHWT